LRCLNNPVADVLNGIFKIRLMRGIMPLKRREFLKAGIGSLVAAGFPALSAVPARKHKVGHTGITWGYPAPNAEQAIHDVGELGYHGFESFGSVLDYWESQGGFSGMLTAAKLPLIGAYCPMVLTDAAQRKDEIRKLLRWGKLIKKYGGSIAVIGPDNVDRQSFNFKTQRSTIIGSLNAMGLALQDIGVTAALHQHTGSCIETRDETYAVMESVNPQYMKLCPDTGELLNAGADPVQVVKDFLSVIAHVHLKDFDGGSKHEGYCPVGKGRVDMQGVVEVLETSIQDFMLMAELNPATSRDGNVAGVYQLALASKRRLAALGYEFS
jgi:inosose dehydratase